MKTRLGLDWIDLLIHVAATIFIMIMVGNLPIWDEGSSNAVGAAVAAVAAISLVVLGLRRKQALAKQPVGDVSEGRLAEVEDRLGQLEHVHDRLLELEERLEFAERLLTRQSESPRLGADAAPSQPN